MKINSLLIVAGACVYIAGPASAQTVCDPVETFRDGETVEQLAARCGVSSDALLQANRAESADVLIRRDAIAVPQNSAEGDWVGRARSAVVDAGRQINDAATAAGRSVSDYLKDQPDLNREVLSLGEKLGLPGVDAGPSTGPNLEVAASGDGSLSVSASGLPGDTEIILGWLDDGVVKPVETFRTDERGHLTASVARSASIPDDSTVLFVIETADKKLRLAADPIDQN